LALFLSYRLLVERVLGLPPQLHDEATGALQLVALGLVARTVSSVLNTPQLVRLRMDLSALIASGTGTLQICLVPLVLFLQGGLKGAVAVITGMAFVAALLNLAVSSKLQPLLLRTRIQFSLIPTLVRFGGAVILVSLSGILVANTEKL
jgi:O-antigen/teichoic acid export membrane protein